MTCGGNALRLREEQVQTTKFIAWNEILNSQTHSRQLGDAYM